jgi:hypothetical protein
LWDRGKRATGHRFVSISAWAFRQALKWDTAVAMGLVSDAAKHAVAPAVSAMRVFHAWIGDTDRRSDHIYLDADSPDDAMRIAFIDHAYSMSFVWQTPDHVGGCGSVYMPMPLMAAAVTEAIDTISNFSDDRIRTIVNRVPSYYLPDYDKRNIIGNLLKRREKLPELLKARARSRLSWRGQRQEARLRCMAPPFCRERLDRPWLTPLARGRTEAPHTRRTWSQNWNPLPNTPSRAGAAYDLQCRPL